jgi:hypothetical protein
MKKNVYTLILIIVCLVACNNIFALDSSLKKDKKNPYSYYPHKGAILLGAEYLAGDKIDKGFKKTIDTENSLLTGIGLTWNTLDDKGNIISTEHINNYSYSGNGLTVGLRLLYFATDNLAIGGRFGNYSYSQTLTIEKKDVTGNLMEFNYLGPSINWYAFKKNRFGILLKSDFSMVIGKQETIPALNMLISDSYFSDKLPETLASSIKTAHLTSQFYGFQCNGGISAHYFFANWFNLDAGIQFYYFTGSFNKLMLVSQEKSINSISPVFNLSVNFLLRNKHLN